MLWNMRKEPLRGTRAPCAMKSGNGPTQSEGCATKVLSTRQLDSPKLAGRGGLFLCCRGRQRMGYFTHANKNTRTHPHSCSHIRTRHTAHAHDTHATRVAHDTCTNIRETYKTHTAHMTHTRHAQNTRQTHMTRHVNPRGVRLIVFTHESHLISNSLEITTNCHPQVGSQVLSVFFLHPNADISVASHVVEVD